MRQKLPSAGPAAQFNKHRGINSALDDALKVGKYGGMTMARRACMLLAILTLAFSGCVTGEKMTSIRPGMSQAEVEQVLGRPDGFTVRGEHHVLKYTNKLISGWSWDRADYFVILRDDKVIEYGSGDVRERSVNGVHTIFIHQF